MNSMYFNEKDINNGLLTAFITILNKLSYDSKTYYNDIHIKPEDCGAFSVEWSQEPWTGEYGGGFQYVDEDQEVCTDLEFPDGHFEYVPVGAEEDSIEGWLEENPGWRKNEYGRWVNEEETIPSMHNIVKPNTNWETKTMLLNAEQEDELREGTDSKYLDVDYKAPTTITEAKPNWYVDYNEPYKFSVLDD